jgi:hypothetical protein
MTVPIPEGGMQFDTLQVSAAVAGQVYCWGTVRGAEKHML